jgi:flagellar basal body-associated protein FliL
MGCVYTGLGHVIAPTAVARAWTFLSAIPPLTPGDTSPVAIATAAEEDATTTVADPASTTAMAVDEMSANTLDLASTVATGSVKVTNINYEQLMNNEALRNEFETRCRDRIAASASSPGLAVKSSQVALTLSQGSVVVDYVIAELPRPLSSDNVPSPLHTAIGDGSFFHSLAIDINTIPGIDAVAEGTIDVELGSSSTADDEKQAKDSRLVFFIIVGLVLFVFSCCCVAGVYRLSRKRREQQPIVVEPKKEVDSWRNSVPEERV